MSTDKVKCDFCNNEFTNKIVLGTHQRRAKYCLAIQKKENANIVSELIECEYCLLKSDIYKINNHYETCKAKIQCELKQKDDLIEQLRKQKDKQVNELRQEVAVLRAEIKIYKKLASEKSGKKNSTIIFEKYENIETKDSESQTEPDGLKLELIKKLQDQVKNQEIELKKLRSSLQQAQVNKQKINKGLYNHIKELETELKKYQKQNISSSDVTNIDPNTKIFVNENKSETQVIMIGNLPMIVRSIDGYINATELCKAAIKLTGRKRRDYNHWKDQADGFLVSLSRRTGIPVQQLVHSTDRFVDGKRLPTMIHPLAGINMCGWLDDDIGVDYVAWIFELKLRGTVTIGQEHTIDENMSFYREQVAQLTNDKAELDSKYQILVKQHKILNRNHNVLKKKRKHHTFKTGNCMYVCSIFDLPFVKVGRSENINDCLKTYRRLIPDIKLTFLVYFDETANVEKTFGLKNKYPVLMYENHEVYKMSPKAASDSIISILEFIDVPYTIEDDLDLYNDSVLTTEMTIELSDIID